MKTKPEKASVTAFLKKVDASRREDCQTLVAMMKQATGAEPVMWGPSIIGFGARKLVYDSGRVLDWFQIGFSPRKAALTLYLAGGPDLLEGALQKLGKYERGKGCLYVKRLADVDTGVLKAMLKASVAAKE